MTSCGTLSMNCGDERIERFGIFAMRQPVTLQRNCHARQIHGILPGGKFFHGIAKRRKQHSFKEIELAIMFGCRTERRIGTADGRRRQRLQIDISQRQILLNKIPANSSLLW